MIEAHASHHYNSSIVRLCVLENKYLDIYLDFFWIVDLYMSSHWHECLHRNIYMHMLRYM